MSERPRLYGSVESNAGPVTAGPVKMGAYVDEIIRHLADPTARNEAKLNVALNVALAVAESDAGVALPQDFRITSNAAGMRLERAGDFTLAAQCYEWSYRQSDALVNFADPNTAAYAVNLVRVLGEIYGQGNNAEEVNFVHGKRAILGGVGRFLATLTRYFRYQSFFEKSGGAELSEDQLTYYDAIDDSAKTAFALEMLIPK